MRIQLDKDVHIAHNQKALEIHELMKHKKIVLINLLGSPGSGKTSLLECLIQHSSKRIGVIEGDLFTDLDHQRIVQLGVQSYQLNTQGACHLEPAFIEEALKRTVNKSNPTISYVNGILVNWHKKGFKNVKDIENENSTSHTESTSSYKRTTGTKTKYQEVSQREYTNLESFYDNM